MTSEIITAIIVSVLGSSGLFSLLTCLITYRLQKKDKRSKEEDLEIQALLAILHDKIYSLSQYYIERGCISADENENLEILYIPYEGLGGNGTGKKMWEEVKKLPTVSGEKAREKDMEMFRKGEINNVLH